MVYTTHTTFKRDDKSQLKDKEKNQLNTTGNDVIRQISKNDLIIQIYSNSSSSFQVQQGAI